jgi:hypothetical protein
MTRISCPVVLAASLLAVASLGGCTQSPDSGRLAIDPNTPGSTGRTIVIGNNSTIAGDAAATEQQQKWPLGRGR